MYHFELTATEIDWLRKILENEISDDLTFLMDSDSDLKMTIHAKLNTIRQKLIITNTILEKLNNAEHENTD